jgi:hypothetical protein
MMLQGEDGDINIIFQKASMYLHLPISNIIRVSFWICESRQELDLVIT